MLARKMGWLLAVIGAVASVAALLGPSERVLGIDLGATGASAFWLSIGAGAWLLAKRSDEVFPEHMSITERRAWISVAFLILILAAFISGMRALADGEPPESIHEVSSRFPLRLTFLVGAWALCTSVMTRDAHFEVDERDLQYRQRADRAANLALNLGVVAAIVALVIPREALSWWLAPLILAHVLIGVLMARALVENLALALAYRRA